MISSPRLKCLRTLVLAVGLLLGAGLASRGEPGTPPGPTCLEDLENLSGCQLHELFTRADIGQPISGVGRGRIVYRPDRCLPKLKARLGSAIWRGKTACEDGYFINRWIGNINWIDSHYVVGPSWLDGKPAFLVEYPSKTPLLWNMHDEMREIAPGLYLGPIYDRFPCPKFRGYLALQMECCEPSKPHRGCR